MEVTLTYVTNSLLSISSLHEEVKRQANDVKEALDGRQPVGFTQKVSLFFILSFAYLFIKEKKNKIDTNS